MPSPRPARPVVTLTAFDFDELRDLLALVAYEIAPRGLALRPDGKSARLSITRGRKDRYHRWPASKGPDLVGNAVETGMPAWPLRKRGEGPRIGTDLLPKTHQPVIVRDGMVSVAARMRKPVAPIAGPMSADLEQFVSYARTSRTEENLPGQDGRGHDLDPKPVDMNSALASGQLVTPRLAGKLLTPEKRTPQWVR
jgi:hypothetical protein